MKTLLKDAWIVDGTGEPGRKGSVVISADRIIDIVEQEPEGFLGKVVDCEGKILSPGFIDVHSHNDWFADRDEPMAYYQPFVEQGIVTECTGNCGFSAMGYEQGQNVSDAMSGYKKDGRDFADLDRWFEFMDRTMPSNQAALLAHGTLRYSLVGKSTKPLDKEQMEKMKWVVRESLAQGACGVSMGLEYAPGMYAPYEELLEVARIVKEYDSILTLHTRALGKISGVYPVVEGGRPHNLIALDEAVRLGRDSGCKIHYSHASFSGKGTFDTNEEMLATIDRANEEGIDTSFDIYSLPAGMSFITYPMPDWYQALSESERYEKENLERFKKEFYEREKVNQYGFDLIVITNDRVKGCKGKSVTEIAKMWGMEPFDAYIKLVQVTKGEQRILQRTFVDDSTVEPQSKHPKCLFMTDAWFEPGCIQNYNVYGCFPHLLELSRDGRGPGLEECIAKMTGNSARRFKIPQRGFIKSGMYADICVFDLEKIQAHWDRKPDGFEQVFMNGIHVIENGDTYTERLGRAGRAVRVINIK
ncbi:MAG: amidohydrolase family protein [Lachnospiraceae bacterium]|nr:amidohydrolase family protein [Lachnospiraceae bacterium]